MQTDEMPYRRQAGLMGLVIPAAVGLLIGLLIYRLADPRGNRAAPATSPRAVTTRGDLESSEKANIEIFRQASPSVVFITTLAQRIDFWTRNVTEVPQGTGSGFVWDESGHIVTNYHVVQGGSSAQVTLADQSTYDAKLVGASPNHDLAVLKIDAPREKLHALAVGTSGDLQVGQHVYAIGNPFGLDHTLTTGIVSALKRQIKSVTNQPIEDVIQTDAAINPGNSGGPLLDSAGRLIGVNTAIYSPSGSSAGIGFAVPVDTVNRIVPQLIANGKVERASLGVGIEDSIGQRITRQLNVEGVLVLNVQQGTGAAAAGLRGTVRARNGTVIPGDIIQAIDGKPVKQSDDIYLILQKYKAGDTVTLTLNRRGKIEKVPVQLTSTTD